MTRIALANSYSPHSNELNCSWGPQRCKHRIRFVLTVDAGKALGSELTSRAGVTIESARRSIPRAPKATRL